MNTTSLYGLLPAGELPEEVPWFPRAVRVEPTNICNLRCGICPTGLGIGRPVGMMEWDLFVRLAAELQERCVETVGLFFAGEPLLHKRIVDMVEHASALNLRPYFHTNGMQLDRGLSRRLIVAGLDYVSFSFEGTDPETYKKLRHGSHYRTVLDNINGLIETKLESGSAAPRITVQVVDIDGGGHGLEEFRQRFLRPDEIELKVVPGHGWDAAFADSTGLKEQSANPESYYPCESLWEGLFIGWDGRVMACCRDLVGNYIIGDLREQTLDEVWNGEQVKKFRRAHINHEPNPFCRVCGELYLRRTATVRRDIEENSL